MESVYQKNAKVFKALCDEKRLMILDYLKNGEMCVCALMDKMEIGQSSLSYHMKILCESGIVSCRPEGKWSFYSLSHEGSNHAKELLHQITKLNIED